MLQEVTTVIDEYLNSPEWRAKNYGDYLLHEAASQSLDLTIKKIGVDVFKKALSNYRKLLKLALSKCPEEVQLPCSGTGQPQLEISAKSCYKKDLGCAYQCINEVVSTVEL